MIKMTDNQANEMLAEIQVWCDSPVTVRFIAGQAVVNVFGQRIDVPETNAVHTVGIELPNRSLFGRATPS